MKGSCDFIGGSPMKREKQIPKSMRQLAGHHGCKSDENKVFLKQKLC